MEAAYAAIAASTHAAYNIPAILADEWDVGYLGRLGRTNGISGVTAMARLPFRIASELAPDVEENWTSLILAALAGVDRWTMLAEHGLLPLERALAPCREPRPHELHETPERGHFARLVTLGSAGAMTCRACVEEDQHQLGSAYWRRTHQLPGQLWCHIHAIPLHRSRRSLAFLQSPTVAMDDAVEIDLGTAVTASSDACIASFMALQRWLLEQETPLLPYLSPQLCALPARIGYRLVKREAALVCIRAAYPGGWLEHVLSRRLPAPDPRNPDGVWISEWRMLTLLQLAAQANLDVPLSASELRTRRSHFSLPPAQQDLFLPDGLFVRGKALNEPDVPANSP